MGEARKAASRSAIPASVGPNVRRNLFSAQTSRPTGSSNKSAPATLADGTTDASGSEILVRNPDGSIQFSVTPSPPTEIIPTPEQEADAKLGEMLANRSRQSSEAELFNAIKASLRRKVTALESDNWMFAGKSHG